MGNTGVNSFNSQSKKDIDTKKKIVIVKNHLGNKSNNK